VNICPVKDFDIKDFTGRFKNNRYLNRGAQFALASALSAIKRGKISPDLLHNAGLFVGAGPNLDIPGEFPNIADGNLDWNKIPALWILKFLPNTAASAIAQLAGTHGENLTVGNACAASLMAVGEAFRKIRDGYLDIALAGSGDSRLNPGSIMAYKKAGALYNGDFKPENACRPFDKERNGFVSGEGGAFFLLEELEHARARGAEIYGEICGYGASVDGYNMTAPEPDAKWAEKAVRKALDDAGITPEQVELISAHGTGTPLNDAAEAELIQRVFRHKPFISAFKSWTGHLSAACGALELALCIICMKNGWFPEIRNLKNPCREEINFMTAPEAISPETILVENFGFGGKNSALVIKPLFADVNFSS
jgi:3-oxoacyl-[acyl-carrier-protein] synthase II